MKKIIFIVLFCVSFYFANSYDNETAHREFNKYMIVKFKEDYSKWSEFKNYLISFDISRLKGNAITKSGKWNPTITEENYTADKWIIEGGYSADEPEVPAAYRHFYDPLSIDGKTYLTDINKLFALFNPQIDAINWHFIGNDPTNANEWTWILGKDAMMKAVLTANESERNSYLAKAYRCLGEVLHNTADMGCPPHVRNDAHGGSGLGGGDPYESTFQPSLIPSNYKNEIGQNYKNTFEDAETAIDINIELANFTNRYFFSDETISGIGIETYSSRNSKKDHPNPKLENLIYEDESFNYFSVMPSGKKVQMCNDQSILLGFLAQDYRSYPRITKANVVSQSTELIPMIIDAGKQVIRRFIPIFQIEISIDAKEKKLMGLVKHIPTYEYASTLNYNGKIGIKLDQSQSNITTNCTQGKFEISEIDSKFSINKKIQAFINLADITILSNEIINEIVQPPTLNGVQNLSDKWKRYGIGFSGDTIVFAGKFPGITDNNLKILFTKNSNELVEAQFLAFNTTSITAIVPNTRSNNLTYPSTVKVFIEINKVKSEELNFQVQNWWLNEFCNFKVFNSDIEGTILLDNGSKVQGDLLDKNSEAAFWNSGIISDRVCDGKNFSFKFSDKSKNGNIVIMVAGELLNDGRAINISYDIDSYTLYTETDTKKKEIKTYKNFSINKLNYYGIWGGGIGDVNYYDNPNFEEYKNSDNNDAELITKLKINKYEIHTIETDKTTNPPTQKTTIEKINSIEKIDLMQIQIGDFSK